MKLIDILYFIISSATLYGVWQFIWLHLILKFYDRDKQELESFYDFYFRYCEDNILLKVKKKLVPKFFYRIKVYKFFKRLIGFFLLLLSLGIAILLLCLSLSDYSGFLYERF